MTQRQVKMF